MKQKLIRFSQRYATALRKHLEPGPPANPQPALRLGREAVALGLEKLELAQIHKRALARLKMSEGKIGFIKRAEVFFAEALTPIVENHHASRQSKRGLDRRNLTLSRRTAELATAGNQLQRGIARCKVIENVSDKNGRHHEECLQESLELQNHLRQMTHRVLAAQEEDRRKISHELQDEIAQTLLGINVRLVALKQNARSNTKDLKHEIASTQRMVTKSARSVRRFARELNHQPPSQHG